MRLTRVLHTDCRVVHGPAAELLPDVAPAGDDPAAATFECLLFVDGDGAEAHGYLFPEGALRELAERILRPAVEVARIFPGAMLK